MQLLAFVLASLAASVYAADLVVNTPVKDNGDIVGDADRIFGTTYAWGGYGAPAGSSVVFTVTDLDGNSASTAAITVSDSSDSSCLDPGA
ncbi:hypothetical protein GSI_08648 [Ganoderma sinense ZZ0214-1]|uniref:HYR domain-containing protein n=1 Tax=Ganoderma sinense ZZ0214-1 TaxID=1077348 RepID=A0A2G8S499_9APHY|nr:hypothetical protein GSI_08648 [Ganoderma sinense ZZ0214-1]